MNHHRTSIYAGAVCTLALSLVSPSFAAISHAAGATRAVETQKGELIISRFEHPKDAGEWKFTGGLPGSAVTFDSQQDAGGGKAKGSLKLVLPFTKDGEFDFNLEKYPTGADLKAKGYSSISLDVKVDPKSPAWGDFHAGWFELGITTGKDGHTFIKEYGENLDTRNGWFHLSVPITGDVSDARGFAIKFFASGLTTGNRVVWIDNLVLSTKKVAGPKPAEVAKVPTQGATSVKPGAEMLANGGFGDGISKWVLEQSGSAKGIAEAVPEGPEGKPSLRLKVVAVEDHAWHLQIYQTGMQIEKGQKYEMTFWARAERSGVITAEVTQNHEPWEHETNVKLPVTSEWTLLHFTFKGPWTDDNVRICFTDLGTVVGQTYWFANCSLKAVGTVASDSARTTSSK